MARAIMLDLSQGYGQNLHTCRGHRSIQICGQVTRQELGSKESLAAQCIDHALPLFITPRGKAYFDITLLTAAFLYLGHHAAMQDFETFDAAGAAISTGQAEGTQPCAPAARPRVFIVCGAM
jgi:hypothetical protein